MPTSTVQIEYREIPEAPGYRFGSNGDAQTRWSKGGTHPKLTDEWRSLIPFRQKSTKHYYIWVKFGGEGNKVKLVQLHTMILWAFISAKPSGMECRHLDGNPANNAITNLAWGTRAQNIQDQIRHGDKAIGERQGSAKLTASKVREMRYLRLQGYTFERLAGMFGVSNHNVWEVCTGKTWRHVL
jgi:HNH endonuclease